MPTVACDKEELWQRLGRAYCMCKRKYSESRTSY